LSAAVPAPKPRIAAPAPTDSATLELPFRAPYDWPRVLRFFAGRATPGVESVEDGAWRRAIDFRDASGTLTVRRHARKRCLVAQIDGPVSAHAAALAAPLARMFDTQADPAAIAAHFADDPWLAPLVAAAPGLRVPGAWSGFELVVRAIVGQQVSVKAATTIIGRLVQRVGRRIESHPHEHTAWRFPTPAALAAADLGGIGMPGKRVAALQGFAQAVASGAVAIERGGSPTSAETACDLDAMRAALLALPGIGPWTVEYVAMRAWRDANAWPATDLVLMQAIAARDPALARPAQQRARSDAWRPWRAYAAMHLWNELADRANAARGG
jgi:DNA-3-methyladenine glycosylase II